MRKCFVAACLLSSLLSLAQPSGQPPAQLPAQLPAPPSSQLPAQSSDKQSAQLPASLFPSVTYPRDYFRDPLDIPITLAANFGELRPNHYHMGLDIRTQHRENLPVFAAADGYVARVEIDADGQVRSFAA